MSAPSHTLPLSRFSVSTLGKPVTILALAALGLLLSPAAQAATTIYTNNFATANDGFSGAADLTGPGANRAIHVSDTNLSGSSSSVIGFDSTSIATFDTTQAGQETLIINFDYAVTSLFSNTAGSNSIPRVRFQNPNGIIASDLFIGFGTNGSGDLVLFTARGNNPGPSAQVLFNYGTYDEVTATNNDTAGYVNLTISYTNLSTTATVTAVQGATTTSFTLTGFTPASFSNATTSNFGLLTGNTTTSQSYLDNVTMTVVPEPSVALLCLAAVPFFAAHRRRLR